jgi:hypothetical protein
MKYKVGNPDYGSLDDNPGLLLGKALLYICGFIGISAFFMGCLIAADLGPLGYSIFSGIFGTVCIIVGYLLPFFPFQRQQNKNHIKENGNQTNEEQRRTDDNRPPEEESRQRHCAESSDAVGCNSNDCPYNNP